MVILSGGRPISGSPGPCGPASGAGTRRPRTIGCGQIKPRNAPAAPGAGALHPEVAGILLGHFLAEDSQQRPMEGAQLAVRRWVSALNAGPLPRTIAVGTAQRVPVGVGARAVALPAASVGRSLSRRSASRAPPRTRCVPSRPPTRCFSHDAVCSPSLRSSSRTAAAPDCPNCRSEPCGCWPVGQAPTNPHALRKPYSVEAPSTGCKVSYASMMAVVILTSLTA